MADFSSLVPHITSPKNNAYLQRYLPKLEQCGISTIDLLTLDAPQVSKQTQISLGDARRLIEVISEELEADTSSVTTAKDLLERQRFLSTGDDELDEFLGGGFITGNLSEIVGESGVGKSQFLLTLLLTIQLPPSNKSAIYISTETQMSTPRLVEIMEYLSLKFPTATDVSLDRVHTITCQYLDTLEHVVQYQLPIAVERFNIGLIVIDSMAANFRGEEGGNKAKILAKRNADTARLGRMLKALAVRHELAVVVSNQVADRFVKDLQLPTMPPPQPQPPQQPTMQGEPASLSQTGKTPAATPPVSQRDEKLDDELLTLDYQQRWFTGWGDDNFTCDDPMLADPFRWKTPALGFMWANVISARIALLKGSEDRDGRMRRWVKVVFAPWAPSGQLKEYEIWEGGVRSKRHDEHYGEQVVQQQQEPSTSSDPTEVAAVEDVYSDGYSFDEQFAELNEDELQYEEPAEQPQEVPPVEENRAIELPEITYAAEQPREASPVEENQAIGLPEITYAVEQPTEPPMMEPTPAESQPEEVELVQYPMNRRLSQTEQLDVTSAAEEQLRYEQIGHSAELRVTAPSQDAIAEEEVEAPQAQFLREPEMPPGQRPRKRYSDEIADSEGEEDFDEDFFNDDS